MCEIAGGVAHTARILIKHAVPGGPNFDLVCGCDLTKHDEQQAFWRYQQQSRVLVVIMSPICSPFGGWSHMNRNLYPTSWKKNLDYALVLAVFCGKAALSQYQLQRHWMNEQPRNSDMYSYDPWPAVCNDPRTVTGEFDQCQFGARNLHKQQIRKRTTIKASCYDLVYYVDGKFCGHWPTKCNGQHQHRRGSEAQQSRKWPMEMARRLAWGVLRHLDNFKQPVGEGRILSCPGCQRNPPKITPTMV
jgi:hypothetical protein